MAPWAIRILPCKVDNKTNSKEKRVKAPSNEVTAQSASKVNAQVYFVPMRRYRESNGGGNEHGAAHRLRVKGLKALKICRGRLRQLLGRERPHDDEQKKGLPRKVPDYR